MRTIAVSIVLTFVACHREASTANADAGKGLDPTQTFAHYASLERDAPKVDVVSFASGDVALAKGRLIATVKHKAHVDWAREEAALGHQSAEADHLLHLLASPRAPYCPKNDIKVCDHPWFADDPSKAGVIVYVEQRTSKDGTYGGSANAYTTVLEFDAVLVPEKVRVARWWRLALPPESQITARGESAGMMIGTQKPETFLTDMDKLSSGIAPVGDFSEDPWADAGTRPTR